jgi:hypothetical protein
MSAAAESVDAKSPPRRHLRGQQGSIADNAGAQQRSGRDRIEPSGKA